jgi:hypothetical protein
MGIYAHSQPFQLAVGETLKSMANVMNLFQEMLGF